MVQSTQEGHAGSADQARTRNEPRSLDDLLDLMDQAADESDEVSIGDILDSVGHRSFAPILILAGLIMCTPVIGDIPGVPILMGLIVIIASSQLMFGCTHLWMPDFVTRRSVDSDKLQKVVGWLRRPARFADKWTKPRLQWAVRRAFVPIIAALCIVIAATTPALELVPFSANLAGIAITAFALALFANDGLIALIATVFAAGVIALLAWQFF